MPEEDQPTTPGCSAGTAHINVSDGFLRNICGCAEAAGTTASPPTTLTCTVNAGTYVFFRYISVGQRQQIAPTGTPSFAPSPISDPTSETPIQAHTVKFDTPGTYGFRDLLNSGIAGQIIVL